MSVYLFTALFYCLLFLSICGALCGLVCTDSAVGKVSAPVKTIEIFTKGEKIKDGAKGPSGDAAAKEVEVNLKDFYSPVLLLAGDYIVALAGINRIDEEKKLTL